MATNGAAGDGAELGASNSEAMVMLLMNPKYLDEQMSCLVVADFVFLPPLFEGLQKLLVEIGFYLFGCIPITNTGVNVGASAPLIIGSLTASPPKIKS